MDHTALLRSLPYFEGIPKEKVEEFYKAREEIRLRCGEVLLQQGETGTTAFVLLDGRLQATVLTSDRKTKVIGEIGRGEILGESAVLLDKPRGATVTALRESILLEISREDLIELVREQPESMLEFTKTIVERSQPTFAYKTNVRSILLFPVTQEVKVGEFGEALKAAVTAYEPAKTIGKEVACKDLEIAPEALESMNLGELSAELTRYERQGELVIYRSQGKLNAWTEACARRVDRIILLANALHFQAPQAAELQMLQALEKINKVKVELVLLHPASTDYPSETHRWFEGRKIHRHYHFKGQDPADMSKLARFLTGNAIGVALSGGGFKSSMQAGILQSMVEGGIPIDMIGGSSGGAFAGAVFARMPEPEKVPDLVEEGMNRFREVMKFTVPLVSLFTGKRLTRGFREFLGPEGIEDLWTNYFCLSLSLVSGDLKVHDHGPVWEAVRASSSVMGLFPPVIKDKDCLVDGGFINPCPTDVLQERGIGKVIVVSAFGKAGVEVDAEYPPSVSGWKLLRMKLNPFYRKKISPSLGTIIIQSMLMASTHLLANIFSRSKVDLFIEPDMSKYSAQDTEAVQKMYEIGYKYGRERVDEWKRSLSLN